MKKDKSHNDISVLKVAVLIDRYNTFYVKLSEVTDIISRYEQVIKEAKLFNRTYESAANGKEEVTLSNRYCNEENKAQV